ncbi:MAG: TonB-dependent receptor [Gammaproteobacteria bacterium]|nr:TonB-dependent receptor [Gammaproteobacteria bacterium]
MDQPYFFPIAITVIASAAFSAGFTNPVFAQEEEEIEVEVEEIVVTGSRIQRDTDANSATPISVFDAEQLKQSGQTTLEDFLQEIPSVTGGQLGSTVNNGNPGLATVSLRGLGAERTLILLNGRRLSSAGTSTGTVDLNTIPTSIIERIEVLRDGASTIYGSDAIAGVINIITKQNFEGAEIQIDAGSSSKNDGQQYLAAMTFGAASDSGNAMLNVQYTRRHDIFQNERTFSECPLIEVNGNIVCGGSGTTSPARYVKQNGDSFILDPQTGEERPFNLLTDGYNFAEVSYLSTPQEVFTIYGYGEQELWNWQDTFNVAGFSELLFANRQSDQLLAPEGTFFQYNVAADNPDNPSPGQEVSVARRFTEAGGRANSQDLNTWRGVIGFKGDIYKGWQWDLSYNYSRWVETDIDRARANPNRFRNLLDQTACDADSLCPGLWNPFIENSLTQAMQDYALVTNSPVVKSNLRSLQANLVGDFGDWTISGEPLQWALGYENRGERADVTVDGAAGQGQIYFVNSQDWGGSYSVDEFYGELVVPLLEGRPGADLLAIEASFRYSDYDSSGSETTYGAVIEYAPIEQLRFRATYAQGFRAPSIEERFLPRTLSAEGYSDPCYQWENSNNPILRANCQADGVPSDNELLANPQSTGLLVGNSELKPEESDSWTVGAVWTPTFAEDLSFSLDYFDISIDNAIGRYTTDTIVRNCYESPDFSDPSCGLISGPGSVGLDPSPTSPRRADDNTIAGQMLIDQNIATFETSGIDLGADYNIDLNYGTIILHASATYLDTWEYQVSSFAEKIDLAGHFGADPVTQNKVAFPKWKLYLNGGYEHDTWSIFATVRMLGKVDDIDPSNTALSTKADTTWYTDINASYFGWEDINISGGIRNMFNQQPPYVTNNDDMNTLQLNYDTIGRFFYGSVTFSF